MVKNISPLVHYKIYFSLKHICRMYQHNTVNRLFYFYIFKDINNFINNE